MLNVQINPSKLTNKTPSRWFRTFDDLWLSNVILSHFTHFLPILVTFENVHQIIICLINLVYRTKLTQQNRTIIIPGPIPIFSFYFLDILYNIFFNKTRKHTLSNFIAQKKHANHVLYCFNIYIMLYIIYECFRTLATIKQKSFDDLVRYFHPFGKTANNTSRFMLFWKWKSFLSGTLIFRVFGSIFLFLHRLSSIDSLSNNFGLDILLFSVALIFFNG